MLRQRCDKYILVRGRSRAKEVECPESRAYEKSVLSELASAGPSRGEPSGRKTVAGWDIACGRQRPQLDPSIACCSTAVLQELTCIDETFAAPPCCTRNWRSQVLCREAPIWELAAPWCCIRNWSTGPVAYSDTAYSDSQLQ